MTETEILSWIKTNLSSVIKKAISIHTTTILTEDVLAAIVMRETGELIAKHAKDPGMTLEKMSALMMGDYSKRPADLSRRPHGYGFTQIDVASFPWFVNSDAWKDPLKCLSQSVTIVEGKKSFLLQKFPQLKGSANLLHYCVSAYNCGEGNEAKVILRNLDPDAYTALHNYGKEVFRFAALYRTLP